MKSERIWLAVLLFGAGVLLVVLGVGTVADVVIRASRDVNFDYKPELYINAIMGFGVGSLLVAAAIMVCVGVVEACQAASAQPESTTEMEDKEVLTEDTDPDQQH